MAEADDFSSKSPSRGRAASRVRYSPSPSPPNPPIPSRGGGGGGFPNISTLQGEEVDNPHLHPQPPFASEICAGEDEELPDHEHRGAVAVVRHLEVFFGHRTAVQLVEKVGVEAVNLALVEVVHLKELRSPAGWLTWRAGQISGGARPMTASHVDGPGKYAKKDNRDKYRRDYLKRWGGSPDRGEPG